MGKDNSLNGKQAGEEGEAGVFPLEIFQRALRGWWLVALAFIIGAAAGMAAWSFRPAQYESSFSVLSVIDFTNTGELTEIETDHALEAVGDILLKPALREAVAAAARAEGSAIDAAQLAAQTTIERRLGTWRVRVRAADPQEAERLAGIWLRLGTAELQTARDHAIVADGLKKRQQSLEDCMARAAAAEPSAGMCAPQELKALTAQLGEAGRLLLAERAFSQGLSSGLSFGEFPTQPEPAQAVLYQRANLVFGGGLIGLALGLLASQGDWAAWLARRRRG